jgi:hypothetical protein
MSTAPNTSLGRCWQWATPLIQEIAKDDSSQKAMSLCILAMVFANQSVFLLIMLTPKREVVFNDQHRPPQR